MNKEDVIWLAGYLEGEGCFGAYAAYRRPRSKRPMIQVAATDEDVVLKVSALFGQKLYKRKSRSANRKQVFYTMCQGDKAVEVMTAILPYMGARRTQKIKEVLEVARLRPGSPSGELQGRARFTNEQAYAIRAEYHQDPRRGRAAELARKYCVPLMVILPLVRNQTYRDADQARVT